MIKKVKTTFLLVILKKKKFLKRFTNKNCKKTNQEEFRVKAIKTKGNKLYVKWKGYHCLFSSWINKKDIVLMGEYFPESKLLGAREKTELVLSNYATKSDLKNATDADTSKFAENLLQA